MIFSWLLSCLTKGFLPSIWLLAHIFCNLISLLSITNRVLRLRSISVASVVRHLWRMWRVQVWRKTWSHPHTSCSLVTHLAWWAACLTHLSYCRPTESSWAYSQVRKLWPAFWPTSSSINWGVTSEESRSIKAATRDPRGFVSYTGWSPVILKEQNRKESKLRGVPRSLY